MTKLIIIGIAIYLAYKIYTKYETANRIEKEWSKVAKDYNLFFRPGFLNIGYGYLYGKYKNFTTKVQLIKVNKGHRTNIRIFFPQAFKPDLLKQKKGTIDRYTAIYPRLLVQKDKIIVNFSEIIYDSKKLGSILHDLFQFIENLQRNDYSHTKKVVDLAENHKTKVEKVTDLSEKKKKENKTKTIINNKSEFKIDEAVELAQEQKLYESVFEKTEELATEKKKNKNEMPNTRSSINAGIDKIIELIFQSSSISTESLEQIKNFKNQIVMVSGILEDVSHFELDFKFRNGPGVKARLRLKEIKNDFGFQETIFAIVALSIEDFKKLKRMEGKEVTLEGEFVVAEKVLRTIYIDKGKIT